MHISQIRSICIRLSEKFFRSTFGRSHASSRGLWLKQPALLLCKVTLPRSIPERPHGCRSPSERSKNLLDELDQIGLRIIAADDELALGDTEVEHLRAGIGSRQLRNRLDLISSGIVTAPKDVSCQAQIPTGAEQGSMFQETKYAFSRPARAVLKNQRPQKPASHASYNQGWQSS